MRLSVTDDLLDRYVAGECTPDEVRAVHRWLERDPRRHRYVEARQRVWEAARQLPVGCDVDAAWARVSAALRVDGGRAAPMVLRPLPLARPRATATVPAGRRAVLGVAAALVISLAAAAIWWPRGGPHRSPATGPPAMREIATAKGQLAELRLADGTRVVLGVASRIGIPADFGAVRREISLDGEAYFEVTHDSTRPFLVRTARTVTEDLGTRFAVRSYRGDSTEQVVVAEGRVAVHDGVVGVTVLRRGDLARITATRAPEMLHSVDVGRYMGWMAGRLSFDAPLGAVVPELERWYDVEIRLADSALAGRHLVATFASEPIEQVLHRIALALDLRVTRRGRIVRLEAADRRSDPP